MISLTVALGSRSYPIYIGQQLLAQPHLLTQHIHSKQVLILTNEVVAPLYLNSLLANLKAYHCATVILPDGEHHKTLDSIELIFQQLLSEKFSRNSTLIALGGGVIGDMGGFAAACYQRGIHFIQIPTTLLAQVDSSVGGKTGVNHKLGKNMIGAFYQPQVVITDTEVLNTLADRQFYAGLAEVIKYGLIADAAFLSWIEQHLSQLLARDPDALAIAIERSCAIKAQIVAMDELENGIRATLNFGHTFGHALETLTQYREYLHGEAVAIGMVQGALLSKHLGWLTDSEVQYIQHLLRQARLPTTPPATLTTEQYLQAMAVDKKNKDGNIRVIGLEKIGVATLPLSVESSILQQTLVDSFKLSI